MTVVDLNRYRSDREQPDPDHISQDQWGKPMFRFVVEYPFMTNQSGTDRTWTAVVWAYSHEDAELRLEAIRRRGKVAGQVMEVGDW